MKNIFLALLFLFAVSSFTFEKLVKAEESTTDQIKDKAGDVKTDTKKAARTAKRKVRKATDHDNAWKDAKDKGNDVKDDATNEANKLKRKTE